ncbi:MAG: TetR/AcrR family transcriptional regulator [Thermoanaerobaculia bacterium]|jgi:AcrR family transcriptional regulator|nr:TetR/AcrR family transcriptional regulator [Thermoanaerobaculia bacterium]
MLVKINLPLPETPDPSLTPRQAEILDRAIEVVAAEGLGSFTLKQVAERVGFTEAAIYRHFPDKRALVLALVDRLARLLLEPAAAHAADASRPPRERLEAVVRHHVSLLTGTGGLPILLFAEGLVAGDEAIMARLRETLRSYLTLLAGLLAEIDPGPAPPAIQRAILLLGLPAALGLQQRALPELTLRREEIETLIAQFLRALTTPSLTETAP